MGAEPHGSMTLGFGRKTIHQAGCLLCAMLQAARALNPARCPATPAAANDALKAAGAFQGSALGDPRAAALVFGLRLDGIKPFNADELAVRLASGKPVILGIDYKPGRSSGQSDTDHFVTAVGLARDAAGAATVVFVADPAQGAVINLPVNVPFSYSGHADAKFAEMRLYSRQA